VTIRDFAAILEAARQRIFQAVRARLIEGESVK
jgi:hypothetical protein